MGMIAARNEVAELLQGAGLTVKNHVPPKVVPPLVLISIDEPMLDNEVTTFNSVQYDYHLVLFIVGGTATTEEALKAIEVMTEKVLMNLGDWTVDRVSGPSYKSANDNNYLTVSVSVHNTITIGEDS